ncbi:MAG: hypothetical protein U0935_22385 [Pirellulales bacterium]
MITNARFCNFGPLTNVAWEGLGPINLVIGPNGNGKTFLLKALYVAVKTLEEYKRGDSPRTASEILADRLHWTFQADKIGDLVSKGQEGPLRFTCFVDKMSFSYSFGRETTRQITEIEKRHPAYKRLHFLAGQGSPLASFLDLGVS